jgi:uracil-DNA glycosylase
LFEYQFAKIKMTESRLIVEADLAAVMTGVRKWKQIMAQEHIKPKFNAVMNMIMTLDINKVCPTHDKIFRAFALCQPQDVRVVLIGQDPYPRRSDASGLAFSVESGELPASLKNISSALDSNGYGYLQHGNLTHWAQQGVLMLNTALTTVEGVSNAPGHSDIWGPFIGDLIRHIAMNDTARSIIYIAWGNKAAEFLTKSGALLYIPTSRILKFRHPSPLADRTGKAFSDCSHFADVNRMLLEMDKPQIQWIIHTLPNSIAAPNINSADALFGQLQLEDSDSISFKKAAAALNDFRASNNKYCIYYTDGACTGNGKANPKAAWAFVCYVCNNAIDAAEKISKAGPVMRSIMNSLSIPATHVPNTAPPPSNNRAELMAIYEALEYHAMHHRDKNAFIISDSEYAIKTITIWYEKWAANNEEIVSKKNLDIIHQIRINLETLKTIIKIQFAHVKSHKGRPDQSDAAEIWAGNAYADKCATEYLSAMP